MKKCMLITLITFTLAHMAVAQHPFDSLVMKLEKIQSLGYLPGFGVAIVNADGVVFKQGFGYADMEAQKAFTTTSLMNIGSISKTMTGICLAKLIEEGKLNWNTPINDFLPFKIYNPHHRKIPITIEHLATHTSSIVDPEAYERTYLFTKKIKFGENQIPDELEDYVDLYNSNEEMPAIKFIENMIHPLGQWYSKKNFSRKKPGTKYIYSNMGAAIAGHIVETVSGMPFEDYARKIILTPLSMQQSGWKLNEIDQENFVSLYTSNNQKIPPYNLITNADGGLITSIDNISEYLVEMIKGYQGVSEKILSTANFKKIMSVNFASKKKRTGNFWQINGIGEIGHFGGDPGIMTFMMFDPETGYGRIIFANKYDEGGNGYNQVVYIWKTLADQIAKRLTPQG